MTGYQKLKEENRKLKIEKYKLKTQNSIYYKAIMQIIDLKGADLTKAPQLAWEALKEEIKYATENNN